MSSHLNRQEFETPAVGIILAAGKGKRMKSPLPKVMHIIHGKPMLRWAMDSMVAAGVTQLNIVVSSSQPEVHEYLNRFTNETGISVSQWIQNTAEGTAHAVMAARGCYHNCSGNILVGFGDTPAVRGQTLRALLNQHQAHKNASTILAFESEDPTGYGRVVTNQNQDFVCIREQKDCTEAEAKIRLCNSGFLCVLASVAAELLPQITNQNAAQEYYLTDLPTLARQQGLKVGIFRGADEKEFEGVNSPEQLEQVSRRMEAYN
jgi:bifunctional UDP-N-acetylglucosamine pyrophosphorylase / glucosamine-1-phosphate N-acetyltransferase